MAYSAQGGEVASTITRQISEQSGQDNRANAVVQCYENNTLNHSEVCRTLTGNHDDRVTDTGTSVVQIASGVSFDGRKDAPIADGVAHSQTIGTNPGFKDGVVIGLDGYNKTLTGDCAPTISGAACDLHHTHGVISTNSNGEDVAATLTRDLAKQTGAQQQNGGGYVLVRREDSALTDSGSTETRR